MSQNSIEIYVRSSPLGPVGIHWRNVSKDGQPMEEPEILKSRIVTRDNGKKATINSLINDTKPSIVLARYENKILLEVTGLEASEERSSQLGRRITEVVLWIGDASAEVEAQLRQLTACAMLDIWDKDSTFLKVIRDAIRFENLNDFRVDQVAIKQLYVQPDVEIFSVLEDAQTRCNFSVWSTPEVVETKQQSYLLASQIVHTSLPQADYPVIVVGEFKDNRLEYKSNVWRQPAVVAIEEQQLAIRELDTKSQKKNLVELHPPAPKRRNRILLAGAILLTVSLIATLTLLQVTRSPVQPKEEEPNRASKIEMPILLEKLTDSRFLEWLVQPTSIVSPPETNQPLSGNEKDTRNSPSPLLSS